MNNEELFRQALQRQNDRAKGMKMPDDMEQKVMRRIKTRRAAHRWLFPLSIAAVAACLALLMTFHYLYNKVGLYDTLRAVMRHEASASAITSEWQKVDDIRSHMLNFLENHD